MLRPKFLMDDYALNAGRVVITRDLDYGEIIRYPQHPGAISDLIGVLDGLRADFALARLPGETSCREDLHPFNP